LNIVEGEADAAGKVFADSRYVSAGYFVTMRIPVLSGAACGVEAVQTVVVNRSFADTYLPGRTAVGHHLENVPPGFAGSAEIRGVVADAREQGLHQAPVPTVYWCNSAPNPFPVFLLRTAGEPMALAETIRRRIHEIEPQRSMYAVAPLEEHLDMSFAENRLRTILLSFFALTAVALTCVGLYGTLSYFVRIRRREVGLRMALGAVRTEVAGRFLLKGLWVSLLGCVAGLCLAAALGRALSGMLFGVTPSDPATYAGVVLLVLLTAAFSSLFPALRAARVDPMQVLREE
jgi:putative ABC transport system permease protein